MVYGTCLDQSGTIPLYIPAVPYSALILAIAAPNWLGYSCPGLDNWIFNLIASHGQSNKSAIT